MRISVVIPVFNGEKHIESCLKSVRAQTFPDFECLCVDNGSTDKTAQIVSEFAARDARFKLIFSDHAGKQAGARNKGLEQAQGDLITYVDADDFIHPRMLEILLSVMERESADAVGCAFKKEYTPYSGVFKAVKPFKTTVYNDPFAAFLTKRAVAVSACTRLFKRECLKNIRFMEGIFFEDVPWAFALFSEIGRYVQISAPLYYYYINPASTMRSDWSDEKKRSYIEVIRAVAAYTKANRSADWKRVQKLVLNKRVKMIVKRLKKTPADKRAEAVDYARREIGKLYDEGIVSYAGLKPWHRFFVWKLLRKRKN